MIRRGINSCVGAGVAATAAEGKKTLRRGRGRKLGGKESRDVTLTQRKGVVERGKEKKRTTMGGYKEGLAEHVRLLTAARMRKKGKLGRREEEGKKKKNGRWEALIASKSSALEKGGRDSETEKKKEKKSEGEEKKGT